MKKILLMLIYVVLCGIGTSFAQTPSSTPIIQDPKEMIREVNRGTLRFEVLRGMSDSAGLARADLIGNIQRNLTLSDRDKELTAMSPEDKVKFKEFLDLPKTGFIRFHDSSLCNESKNIINAEGPCPWGISGKATAYSFRKKLYTVSVFSDVRNYSGSFQIFGINQLGFIADLGDVPLETLNLQSPGIKLLADFKSSSDIEEIKYQHNLANKGFVVGDYVYRSEMPIGLNQSYVLRSIAYNGKAYRTFGDDKIDIFEDDERKDIIVVFRVISKHDDGSYGVLWKELRREDSPTITAGK